MLLLVQFFEAVSKSTNEIWIIIMEDIMKKLYLSVVLLSSVLFSNISFAGCGEWGPVNYVYSSSGGVLAIINGTACFVTGSNLTSVASVLSVARANGLTGYVTSTGAVAIQYN